MDFRFLKIIFILISAVSFFAACTNKLLPDDDQPDYSLVVPIVVDTDVADGKLEERYIGFAVDTAQFNSGRIERKDLFYYQRYGMPDLESEKLRNLARGLAPSVFRIGGTDADGTYFCPEEGDCELPESYVTAYRYKSKFDPGYYTHKDIRQIADFADSVDADVMFCLNFGPGPRDPDTGIWTPHDARRLIKYARSLPQGDRFRYWEAGNESNGLFFNMDMPSTLYGPKRYARDIETLRKLIDDEHPEGLLCAPGSYFYPLPIVGDINRFTAKTLEQAQDEIDIITWHLYATQSENCQEGRLSRLYPATLENLFNPKIIKTSRRYARYVKEAAGDKPVYLAETASAQCGGQAGVSDTLLDALWYADWIGIMCQEGSSMFIRQTLADLDYGMIEGKTLEPRPTLLAMTMFRRLVARARLQTTADRGRVKAHAFCHPDGSDAITLVVANPGDSEATLQVELKNSEMIGAEQWTLATPEGLYGKRAHIQNRFTDDQGRVPFPPGDRSTPAGEVHLAVVAAQSLTFIKLELSEPAAGCGR